MLRIAIVEDETIYQEQISSYLKQLEKEQQESFELTVFSDGDQIVRNYQAIYDLILLDIQMKFVDGMQAAEEIRELDSKVMIIFVTNMGQYAVQGYEVNAFDFILKPLNYFAFSEKLKRALKAIKKQETKYISIKADRNQLWLAIGEIEYIESIKHRILIHTSSESYSFSGTMKEMEARLEGEHFFRCNNSYLVNLDKVKRVNASGLLVGDHALQISRPRRKAFMKALTDHIGGI